MSLADDAGLSRGETSATLLAAISGLSRGLGMAGVLAMLIAVNIEVIGRSFFDHSTIWVTEVTTYLVVAITFLAAAFAVARDAHVRVDLLMNRLSPARRAVLVAALGWVAVFLALVVFWKFAGFWAENRAAGTRSWSLLNTPLWMPQTAALIGLAALPLALALAVPAARLAGAVPVVVALILAMGSAGGWVQTGLSQHQSLLGLAVLSLCGAAFGSGLRPALTALALAALAALLFMATRDLGLAARAGALIAALFLLLLSGLPVVFSLLGIGVGAMALWLPPVSLNYIGERSWQALNTFELAAIPMFVMMGSVLVRSNASGEMFAAARVGIGRLRGGLAYAAILASGIFAAVSGSSIATAATMGRVAGPEMMQQGYRPELAYGVLAAGGTLGILIPPSIAMIVYGPMAGVPVTDLFMAGILPGLLMILAFGLVVLIWGLIDPAAAPAGSRHSLRDKLVALKGVIPFLVLMGLVLGSLYAGIATPTEAGAVGVLGALLISLARGTLTLADTLGALEEAALTSAFLLLIAVGAAVMGFAIDFLAMPQALVELVRGLALSDLGLFVAIVVLFLILGMFVEPISMVLMTLPILLPVLQSAGWDLLWFGVVLVMLVEIGLITPPVGMILYVLSGVAGDRVPLGRIAIGTLPFVAAFLAMVFLFFALPGLVTFLPEMMR